MRRFTRLAAEVGFSLMILGVPLALGGVHKPTISVACLISFLTLTCVFNYRRQSKRKLRVTWFGMLLMALTAYTTLQMIPLPMKLLSLIAPATVAVLNSSLVGIPGAGGWHSISLDPSSTFWEALKIGTCAMAFIAAHNFLYRAGRRKRILMLLAGGGVLLVIIGLIGAVVAPRQPLLFYSPSAISGGGGLITTSFVNPNHGAAFLIICTTAAVGLVLAARDLQKKLMLGIAGVLTGTGVFLTLSRGGILAMAASLVVLTVLLLATNFLIARSRTSTPSFPTSLFGRHFRHSAQTRMSSFIAILPGMVALVLVASTWLAYADVAREFAYLLPEGSADWSKTKLWPSGLAMVLANPWVGVGRGAFMTAFPRFLEVDLPNKVCSHMENQYIHLPAELGIVVGAGVILASAVALWMWFVKGHHGARSLSVIAALVALALHNSIDFSLEILGVALPAAVLAGLLSAGVTSPRTHRKGEAPKLSQGRFSSLRSVLGLGMAVVMLGLAFWSMAAAPPDPWEDDARLARQMKDKVPLAQFREAAHEVIKRHPSDFVPHLAYARYAAGFGKTEALASLNKAMFLFPRSPQIHLEAARTLRRFGKLRQALLEYRFALEYGAPHRPVLKEAFTMIRSGRDLEVLLPSLPAVQAAMAELLLKSTPKAGKVKAAARIKMAHDVLVLARKDWSGDRRVQMASVEVLLAQGETAKARNQAEELILRHRSPATHHLLARAAGRDRGPRAAVAVLAKARRLYPLHRETGFALARAYVAARDYDSAVKVVKEIQEHSQSTKLLIKTHDLLSYIYKISGNHHLSRHHVQQIRRLQGKK